MKKTIITMFALGLIVSPSFAGSTVANSNNSDTITNNYTGDTNYDNSSTNNIDNTNYASNYSYNNANSTAYSGASSSAKSNSNSDSNSTSSSSATGGNSTATGGSSTATGGNSTNANESRGGNSSVVVRNTPSAPPAVAPTVVGQAGTNSVSGGVSTILGGVSGGVSITTKAAKKQIEATTTAIDIQNLKDLNDLDPDTAAKIKRSIMRRYK